MPSIIARTYGSSATGRLGNVGAVGLHRVSLVRGARSGKFANGVATLLKPCNRANHLIGAAAYRGTLGKQASRLTSNGGKHPTSQGVSLQRAGSMRVANNRRAMAACGAKGCGTKRTLSREGTAIGAHGAGAKRPRPMAACSANGLQVARPDKACAVRVGDVGLMVGSAQEYDAVHAERHPKAQIDRWAKICARCAFTKWKRTHQAPHWLMPKPMFMCGAWGLGCIWCAASRHSATVQARRREHMRQNTATGRCKQAVSRASTWSAYSQRNWGSEKALLLAVHQHQITDLHRMSDICFHSAASHSDALNDPRGHSMQRTAHSHDLQDNCETPHSRGGGKESLTMQPAALASSEGGSQRRGHTCYSSSDRQETTFVSTSSSVLGSTTDHFRGRVPQIQEWIDNWASSTSAVSIWGLLHICHVGNIFVGNHIAQILLFSYGVLLPGGWPNWPKVEFFEASEGAPRYEKTGSSQSKENAMGLLSIAAEANVSHHGRSYSRRCSRTPA